MTLRLPPLNLLAPRAVAKTRATSRRRGAARRWPPPMTVATATLATALAACGGDLPENPTYFSDVAPILRANCARCHGATPSSPKIAKFRLDRYVRDDAATFDTWDYAQTSGDVPAPLWRVAVDHASPAMPPDYPLSERQREILARWIEQGALKGARANHAPKLEVTDGGDLAAADQTLALTVRAWDDDLDGLVAQLWAHDLAGAAEQDVAMSAVFGAGRHPLELDTGALASRHTFELYAVLDDGYADQPEQNRTRVTLTPALVIDHGARGTAPTVKLTSPNGGETLIGASQITWTATDPDAGDTLTIGLELMRAGSDEVASVIATGLTNTGAYDWRIPATLPTSEGGVPLAYQVRITATDALGVPHNVRSDRSDAPFTVATPTTTTLTWADVKPIFVTYCGACHGQPARSMSLESFRIDKYDAADPEPPANSDLGVYEMRGAIYQRMITAQTMPPAAEPAPTAMELERVQSWLAGGAPRGDGPANARPTFLWQRPNATETGSPTALLQWSASDAEGLASGQLSYAKVNGTPSMGCSNLGAVTWTPIADPKASRTLAGAASWTDSFAWVIPSTPSGYYCVRGSVTDTANQTTTVVNPYGVR